jgi:hypothetical protein
MKGFVYVFKQSGTTFYKIGMSETDSVNDRFIQFKTYSPTGCEIISVIETDHARYLEKKLHTQFAEKRMSGEFFNLTDVDIATIKNYESEKIATLNNFFWQYIVGKNLDLDAMRRVLSLMDKTENVSFDKKKELILLEVSKNFNNMSVTNTEIYDKINAKYPSITKKMLGMILKKKYTSKIVRNGNSTNRIYTIIPC